MEFVRVCVRGRMTSLQNSTKTENKEKYMYRDIERRGVVECGLGVLGGVGGRWRALAGVSGR